MYARFVGRWMGKYILLIRGEKIRKNPRGSFLYQHLLGESNPRCRDENPVS